MNYIIDGREDMSLSLCVMILVKRQWYVIIELLPTITTIVWMRMMIIFSRMPTVCTSSSTTQTIKIV